MKDYVSVTVIFSDHNGHRQEISELIHKGRVQQFIDRVMVSGIVIKDSDGITGVPPSQIISVFADW